MKKINWQGEKGNLNHIYEGLIKILEKPGVVAYHLEDAAEKKTNQPWNAFHLKKVLLGNLKIKLSVLLFYFSFFFILLRINLVMFIIFPGLLVLFD